MLKSFLYQSSALGKAIVEAWQQSNCPNVFTVKVIDAGKPGFLGFAHRPSIISFMYDPSSNKVNPSDQLRGLQQTDDASGKKMLAEKTLTTDKMVSPKPLQARVQVKPMPSSKAQNTSNLTNQGAVSGEPPGRHERRPTKKAPVNPVQEKVAATETQPVTEPKKKEPVANANGNEAWNEALVQQAVAWVHDFGQQLAAQSLSIEVVSMRQDELVLQINNSSVLENTAAAVLFEANFAQACATLIVQSLRNRSGLRCKGLKLRLNTK